MSKNSLIIGIISVFLISMAWYMGYKPTVVQKVETATKTLPASISTQTFIPTPTLVIPTITPTLSIVSNQEPVVWKTYANKIHKYKVSYPSDWKLDISQAENPVEDYRDMECCSSSYLSISKDNVNFTFIKDPLPLYGDAPDWIYHFCIDDKNNYQDTCIYEKSSLKILGYTANKIITKDKYSKIVNVYFKSDGYHGFGPQPILGPLVKGQFTNKIYDLSYEFTNTSASDSGKLDMSSYIPTLDKIATSLQKL